MKITAANSLLFTVAATLSTTTCRAFTPLSSSSIRPSSLHQQTTATTTTQRKMISSILDLLGGDKSEMVSPSDALPGRPQKMPNIDGLRHYVLGNDITKVPDGHEVAVFAK